MDLVPGSTGNVLLNPCANSNNAGGTSSGGLGLYWGGSTTGPTWGDPPNGISSPINPGVTSLPALIVPSGIAIPLPTVPMITVPAPATDMDEFEKLRKLFEDAATERAVETQRRAALRESWKIEELQALLKAMEAGIINPNPGAESKRPSAAPSAQEETEQGDELEFGRAIRF